MTDPGFRALALSNPIAAIAKVNPKPLPAGVSIRFVDRPEQNDPGKISGSNLTVVLPRTVQKVDELSDSDLDQAAGGSCDFQFPIE